MSEHETPIKTVVAAMRAVQAEVQNPFKAAQGNKYKYVELDALLDVVRPIATKHGLSIVQHVESDTLITELWHESGDSRCFKMPLKTSNLHGGSEAQEFGAAITYARKYSLMGLFAIHGDRDDDAKPKEKDDAKPALKKSPDPRLDELIASAEKVQPAEPNLAAVAEKMAKTHKNLRVNDLAWMDDPSFEDFIYETAKEKNLSQEDVRLHALKNPEHARQVFTRWKGAPSD